MILLKSSSFSSPFHRTLLVGLLSIGAALLSGLWSAENAQAASSLRTLWRVNGHYYQRIEPAAAISWQDANQNCNGRGAHLATISNAQEQAFITSMMLNGSDNFELYHIGGTREENGIDWKWVTGEVWNYQNWRTNQPGSGDNFLSVYSHFNGGQDRGKWTGVSGSDLEFGFICEWSTHNYIDSAVVPDLNNNGFDEIATLRVSYVTGLHLVIITDSQTKQQINVLSFTQSLLPPQGLVVLNDMNNNGVPEIGVLASQAGFPNVKIKDALNNAVVLQSMNFLSTLYRPKSISVTDDVNNNGSSEIVVLGVNIHSGRAIAEVRDSVTREVIKQIPYN